MRLLRLSLLIVFCVSCGSPESRQVSEQKWLTGAGPTRGHEDLTRLAVESANDALAPQLGFRPFPSIAKGVAGVDTNNMMVRGNYETDFPSAKMYAFHGVSSSVDWHNDGRLQHIHSLRDYPNGQVLGLRQACEAVRSAVANAANAAVEAYRQGQASEGQYWLGHAAHIIQDSFSPAHSKRQGPGRTNIVDLCVYGHDTAGACKHESVDTRDRVWRSTFACQTDPNNRGSSCLKDEARDAVGATAAFLVHAGESIFASKPLDPDLQTYFNCEQLPL